MIGINHVASAILMLLSAALAVDASAPTPSPSNYNKAVAAIQGSSVASQNCKLKLAAQASYKAGSTSVSGTLTVTNPTDATINVYSPPYVIIKSVVPKSQNGSPAVKALMANDKEGSLRQYNPYSGPYYGTNGFDYVMAIKEVPVPNCFASASSVYGQWKAAPVGARKTVTCAFQVQGAVVQGTDPGAVVVSVERLFTAQDTKAIVSGDSSRTSTCSVLAKLQQ